MQITINPSTNHQGRYNIMLVDGNKTLLSRQALLLSNLEDIECELINVTHKLANFRRVEESKSNTRHHTTQNI